jgi:hypothetical protein
MEMMICNRLQSMVNTLAAEMSERAKTLLDNNEDWDSPDPNFCFAYYDAQLLREHTYSFYARLGTEHWGITHSGSIEFTEIGYIPRSDLEHYEEVFQGKLMYACKELAEYRKKD